MPVCLKLRAQVEVMQTPIVQELITVVEALQTPAQIGFQRLPRSCLRGNLIKCGSVPGRAVQFPCPLDAPSTRRQFAASEVEEVDTELIPVSRNLVAPVFHFNTQQLEPIAGEVDIDVNCHTFVV